MKPRFSLADFIPPRKPSRRQRVIARKIDALMQAQKLIASAIAALQDDRHSRGVSLAGDADGLIQTVFTDE